MKRGLEPEVAQAVFEMLKKTKFSFQGLLNKQKCARDYCILRLEEICVPINGNEKYCKGNNYGKCSQRKLYFKKLEAKTYNLVLFLFLCCLI